VVELADEVDGAIEREEVPMAMVADLQAVATVGADAIEDVELPESEVGILGPEMRHGASVWWRHPPRRS
jgi:hypothetical protein